MAGAIGAVTGKAGRFVALAAMLAGVIALALRAGPEPPAERPAPHFELPLLADPRASLSPRDLRGEVWILNAWASWCVPCREEHPVLLELAREGPAPLFGLNYKDGPREAQAWLKQYGDPYRASVSDRDGRVAADYGLAGVPATFVIDRMGVIRYVRAGPLTREELRKSVLPLVRELSR